MLIRLGRKAQSTAEYAALFAIVAALLATMSLYARRGMQARLKDGVDNAAELVAGDAGIFGAAGTQYEPYYNVQGTRELSSTSSQGTERGVDSDLGGQRQLTGATRGSTTGSTSTTDHTPAD